MTTVYISLGSNLNEPILQLNTAIAALSVLPDSTLEKVSSFYQSTPLGPQDQPDYINAVACLKTTLAPLILLKKLQDIENHQGRVRLRRWGERTLDLDILLYGDLIIETKDLKVPHYDMKNREFVIIPLYEIAPDLILPDQQKLSELQQKFKRHTMSKLTVFR